VLPIGDARTTFALGLRSLRGLERRNSGHERGEADGGSSRPGVGAEAFVAALPLLDVDWDLVSDEEFRALLAALNLEASYDSTERELTIRVTLVPELTHPDGPRAPLLSVPPAGRQPEGNGCGQLFYDGNS
jgi:hypothetical protein